jgi:poly(A) polymerase
LTVPSGASAKFAVEVVQRLREAGYQAWWAGGCVRDLLLGREPKDYDVATDARPEQVRQVFGRKQTLAVGAAFGVVMVRGPQGAGQVEIATFREDAEYKDGRHPDHVTFSDPVHDAQRRDFTINGMFYDPLSGEVHDYVGGREDLEKKIVRAIGEPRHRFQEDKLRLLRAVRFTATFAFALDPATQAAVQEMADQIGVVSAERIAAELERMLVHGNRRLAVELLRDTGLLAATLPEVGQPPDRVLRVLAALERPSFSLGLAALFRLAADTPDEAAALCESASGRLKLSNDITDLAVWLVRNQCALRGARSAAWAKMQRLLIRPEIQELVALEAAVLAVEGLPGEDLEFVREKLALAPEVLNPPPLLTGDDLIRHGVPRGPLYKTLLDRVRYEQLEGRIVSQQEALELVDRLREG